MSYFKIAFKPQNNVYDPTQKGGCINLLINNILCLWVKQIHYSFRSDFSLFYGLLFSKHKPSKIERLFSFLPPVRLLHFMPRHTNFSHKL